MPNIGPLELIIVLVVVLLLFGSTRLPKLGRSIGGFLKEFKKGVNDAHEDEEEAEPKPAAISNPDEKVTLTKAELDALLAEREAQGRRDAPSA